MEPESPILLLLVSLVGIALGGLVFGMFGAVLGAIVAIISYIQAVETVSESTDVEQETSSEPNNTD